MGSEFVASLVVGFRESLEVSLLLALVFSATPAYAWRAVAAAVGGGLAAGVVVAVALPSAARLLEAWFFEALVYIAAAIVVVWAAYTGAKFASEAKSVVESSSSGGVILTVVATFAAREALETVLMVAPLASASLRNVALGITAGILLAAAVTVAVHRALILLPIGRVFRGLTLTLLFLGAWLFYEGVGEIVERTSIQLLGESAGVLLTSVYLVLAATIVMRGWKVSE